jgi:hypothetical protein
MASPVAPTEIVGVDADLFAGDDGLADRGQKLVDLPAGFRGKHEMIVNLWPDAAVWKHDLGDQLDHLIAVLAQLLDRVNDLDLIDSRLNEECSAAFRFFLFV